MAEAGLVVQGLGGLDFAVSPGGCIAIGGPSGAGKSTVLRMLADLVAHEGGVWLDGVAQAALPAPAWRRKVAYVAAEPQWWAPRVIDHCATGADPVALVEALGLPPGCLEAAPARLSTGERQRLALLRALCNAPAVLLLDEPTAALDPASVGRVEAVLDGWRARGGIVVLVSHDAAQVGRMAQAQVMLGGAR